MDRETQESQARQRALVIFRVRSGEITAREGARLLGISRKAYYEWEQRALKAMAEALENSQPGRPVEKQDEEKETLKRRVTELEKKLFVMEKSSQVREILRAYRQQLEGSKKNQRAKKG